MIHLEDVVKTYHMGAETIHALDRVNLDVRAGEYVAIVGPSGSGKSTLMNILGCLDIPDAGLYALNGTAINHYSSRQLARLRSRHSGFIFQGFNLLPRLTAFENVELPLIYQNLGRRQRRKRTLAALDQVGLGDRASHRPSQLSGGQQQRAAIARALAAAPSLILADEPTGNLDSRTGSEIMELFARLNQEGNTLMLITHDRHIASRAGRRVYMEDGKIIRQEGAEV